MLVEKAQGVCKYPDSKVHGANMGDTWVLCSWGQHGAHLGPIGPRWTPCWSHEPCDQGMFAEVGVTPVWHYIPARWNFVPSWASIHEAIGRLIARSREVSKPPDLGLDFPIALKFDRHLGSSPAEMPVKCQRDTIITTPNLASSRHHDIWW